MRLAVGIQALFSAAILAATFGESFAADKRVALVIGNSAYKQVSKLPNPVNDAAAIAALLKRAGFDVVESRHDLNINEMRRAARDFAEKTRDADIAVMFYAGHGIEVDGTNYLIPVDAALERDTDVEDEGLSLDRIVKIMEPVRRLRLVILDACRDNPFAKNMKRTLASRSIGRGLAKVEVLTSDMLIAFAAKAGSTASDGDGKNSPFTTALLNNLATPGLDLRLAFGRIRDEVLQATGSRQEPFVYGSLGGSTVALVMPEPTPPVVNMQAEMSRDYALAGQIGTKAAWEQFLSVYSTGFYAGLARAAREKIIAEEAHAAAKEKAAAERAAAERIAADKAAAQKVAAEKAADKVAAQKAAAEKAAAETQATMVVAALPAAPVEPPRSVADPLETARLLQAELRRIGCYRGAANGQWDDDSRHALELFNRHAGIRLEVKLASLDALDVVRGRTNRVCPLQCDKGYKADGETCIKISCPGGQVVGDDGACEKRERSRSASRPERSRAAAPERSRATAPDAPKSGGGQVFCGARGCTEVRAGCRVMHNPQSAGQGNTGVLVCN